ncbi:MAG: recombinase family protein [Clostridiales bacterium]|nr:recombinase family protein [Clostridiales bacterium]
MKCRTAIYCRLSKEDIDKGGQDKFSQSIKNQEAMLMQYAKEHDFNVVRVYRDDDYSGLYEDRPGFERLIENAKEGCFEIIIAKTQARFTRNIEHLEKYLHNEFIQWGIRFIGVVDNVDTSVKGNKKARQINGLVNEWYCQDLSESVKASYRIKQINGEYLASSPPYGYLKDPEDNHHLIVDPYAAEIVRRIYSLYLSGFGKAKIAKILTVENVLRPSVYKRKILGLKYHNAHEIKESRPWTFQTVSDILQNEVYLGHTIQNKCCKISYKSKYKKRLPQKEWIKVENTHESIVDEKVFDMAQEMRHMKTVPVDSTANKTLFWKKLFCADCGKAMTKSYSRGKKTPRETIYICKTYKAHGNIICSSHKISEAVLKALVIEAIRKEGKRLLKEEDIEQLRMVEIRETKRDLDLQLQELEAQLQKTKEYKERLYEDFVDELLSKEEYLSFKKKYEGREASLKKQLDEKKREQETAEEKRKSPVLQWVKQFRNYMDIQELNRDVIEELIEKIDIGADREINVYFRFH